VNIDLLKQCAESCTSPEEVAEFMRPHTLEWQEIKAMLPYGAIHCDGGTVYRVPLLPPEFCDWLVDRSKSHSFKVNDVEEPDVQIDESVLQVTDPLAYKAVLDMAFPMIHAWSAIIYQNLTCRISAIQLASYEPHKIKCGNWHHDRDSDISVVVSLNPDDFEGGGTSFRTSADSCVEIPPLPKGYAVIFPGKHLHHYGLPVTSGRRLLLVFWLSLGGDVSAENTDSCPEW